MHLRFAPRSGPLAREAARLVDRDAGEARRVGVGDPAAHLGQLLDLGGSVAVARTLAELDTTRRPEVASRLEPASIGRVRDDLREGLAELDAQIRRAFVRLRARHKKESLQEGLVLEPSGLGEPAPSTRRSRFPARVKAPSHPSAALAAALAGEASSILRDAHRGARAVRASLVEDLASLSVAAAKLVRLDDALDGAIAAAVEQRLAGLVPAACLELERRVTDPAHAPVEERDVADALFASFESSVRAALEFHRRRLDALVDACAKLSATSTFAGLGRAAIEECVEP